MGCSGLLAPLGGLDVCEQANGSWRVLSPCPVSGPALTWC